MSKLQAEMQKMQEALIDYLVFSGGGAKGVIYSGAYEALVESGIVKAVKAVAGSSAGAVTAAIVAAGIEPEEFTRISREINLKDLLGKDGVSLGPIMIGKDGRPLYDLLDNTLRVGIASFLDKTDIISSSKDHFVKNSEEQQKLKKEKVDLLQQHKQLDREGGDLVAIGEDIKNLEFQIEFLIKQNRAIKTIIANKGEEFKELHSRCRNNGKILFKDLAMLRLLNPISFKDLLITAVKRDNGELIIFSAENTPNVEIALACRASASIPLIFAPAVIDGKEYVDGGYRDNIPMKYYSKEDEEAVLIEDGFEYIREQKKEGRILALAFGSSMDDSANVAIYSARRFDSPNAIVKFLIDVLFKMLARVGGTFKYSETARATENQLRGEAALNTVVLNTQGISTLDFDDAQKHSDYLHKKGRSQTLEYLNNHEVGLPVNNCFELQNFLLNIYESYDHESLNRAFSKKILAHILLSEEKSTKKTWPELGYIKSHQDKANLLLSFCSPKRWKDKDRLAVLTDYVITAAAGRNRETSCDTKSMGAIIETLNNPTTSNKVKEDFINLLAIDRTQDPRLAGDAQQRNIAKFKFDKGDFQNFVDKNKNLALKLDLGGDRSRAPRMGG